MRLMSPAQAWRAILDRLPHRVSDWVWSVSYVFAWVALPYSIVSAVSDLRLVIDAVVWLYERAGIVEPLFDTLRWIVINAMDIWRGFTAPLLDWLRAVLPFRMEQVYLDFAIIVLVCLPSLIRYAFQSAIHKRADVLARTQERLLQAQMEEDARRRSAAEEEQRNNSGLGALVGGLVGGAVGLLFPPVLPAAIAAGVSIGTSAGEASAGAVPDNSAKISELRQRAAREAASVRIAERRLAQSRTLVWASLILAIIAAALIIADMIMRPSEAYAPPRGAATERALCETVKSPGEACRCFRQPDTPGVSRRSHDDTRNYCWLRLGP